MDNTLLEIIKLKNNLMMILNRLIFTSDVNQEISIGGRTVKVLKLMACNRNWLSSFYVKIQ